MSNTFDSRAADTVLPPALSSSTGYATIVTGNDVTEIAASAVASSTALPLAQGKKGYVSVQNVSGGSSVYVAFKTSSGAATVTTSTGWEIPAGTTKDWVVDSDTCGFIEVITASGTATVKLYVSSVVE